MRIHKVVLHTPSGRKIASKRDFDMAPGQIVVLPLEGDFGVGERCWIPSSVSVSSSSGCTHELVANGPELNSSSVLRDLCEELRPPLATTWFMDSSDEEHEPTLMVQILNRTESALQVSEIRVNSEFRTQLQDTILDPGQMIRVPVTLKPCVLPVTLTVLDQRGVAIETEAPPRPTAHNLFRSCTLTPPAGGS